MSNIGPARVFSLPYGIRLLSNGYLEVFNREWQTIGGPFKFLTSGGKAFTPKSERDAFMFYNDATNPTRTAKNMEVYLKKLSQFMKRETEWHEGANQ